MIFGRLCVIAIYAAARVTDESELSPVTNHIELERERALTQTHQTHTTPL